MIIKANNISMNYEISGKGENLVLIHGAGDSLQMWYHQIPEFSKSYRVITYDVRGHGWTEKTEGEYNIPLFAEDSYQLMEAIKVKDAYFLGYSMGGRIALDLAINHSGMVKALILANSSIGLTPPPPEAIERRRMWLELLQKGDIEGFTELMTTTAFSPGFKERNPDEFERYKIIKLQNKPDALTRVIRALGVPAPPPDLTKVKCPVLILVGENDSLMGVEQGKLAKETIADSKLVILPTGHAAAVELPGEFNSAVMEFLSGIRKG
jgi:pimeloyl-ACP methyl ester carboxylesterase